MAFRLPHVLLSEEELKESQSWRIFQGYQHTADKLYILMNIIARDERARYARKNPQTNLFDMAVENKQQIAPAEPEPEQPITDLRTRKKSKHKKDKNPGQLSLFDNKASLFDSNKKNMDKILRNHIKSNVQTSQKHILERCKKAKDKISKRKQENIDYYIAVYGVRKLLGLSQKSIKLHAQERSFSYDGIQGTQGITKIQETTVHKIQELQTEEAVSWLGDVFFHWLTKADERVENAQKIHAINQSNQNLTLQ